MFQNLRPNSQLYIFHKGDTPGLEIGQVVSVSAPKPKYAVPPTFGQGQEMVVDIIIKINNQTMNYNNIPAYLDTADSFSNGDPIVITDNREAMNAEIISFKQNSQEVINSMEKHQGIISSCETILNNLNPEYAEKQQQQSEIKDIKNQMQELTADIASLTLLFKQFKEDKK